MNQEASKKFVDHYQVISAEEGLVRQNMEAEQKVHGSTEISKVLNVTVVDEMPLPKAEPVIEQPIADTSLLNGEPEVPKAEPAEPVGDQVQKSASPKGSKKSSPKHSPQQSPKQRKSPKSSPKQSAKSSRKNSKGNDQHVSPPKSPVIDTAKLGEEINKLEISNVVIPQNTEEAQTIGG